jgi:hypothetical protein
VILTTLYIAGAKNINSWCTRKGDLQCTSPLDVLMVSSSSIAITTDGERLACGGFSLSEPIRLGNLEFIIDYFGGQSLSPWKGNEGAVFVGSIHSGASTPHWALVEDSTEEFLTASSGEGSFGHPYPRWRSTGASFAPTTTAIGKGGTLATTRFPPTDGGAVARNQSPLRASSCSPQRTTDASPCSASQCRARPMS